MMNFVKKLTELTGTVFVWKYSINSESKRKKRCHNLQSLITDFMESEYKRAILIFDEDDYHSAMHFYKSLWMSCDKSGYAVRPILRKDKVFIVKELYI